MTAVVVVGSVNLDLVVQVHRLPVPGETVLGSNVEYRQGGKGANQAVAARKLGADVTFAGAFGDDGFAESVRSDLRSSDIEIAGLARMPDTPTGVAMIVVQSDGENTVTVAPGSNYGLAPSDLTGLADVLDRADVLLLQLEIPLETNLAAALMAQSAQLPVILNAAPLPEHVGVLDDLLEAVDVVVVNAAEAEQLTPDAATPVERARLLRKAGPDIAVVTLGPEGAVAAYADDHVCVQPGFVVETVDGTGAGDTFCAVFGVAIGDGLDVPTALRRACAAGAIATTRLGARAAAPNRDEIDQVLAARSDERRA